MLVIDYKYDKDRKLLSKGEKYFNIDYEDKDISWVENYKMIYDINKTLKGVEKNLNNQEKSYCLLTKDGKIIAKDKDNDGKIDFVKSIK